MPGAPGAQSRLDAQRLAAHLNKSPGTVTNYLSPDELSEKARQAFLDGLIDLTKAYEIEIA